MNFELKGMRLTAQGKDRMHTFIYVATILDDMEKRLIYEELLDEYNRLLAENRLLHEEMDKLKALLNDRNSVTAPPIVKSYLSLEEKVDVFRNLFKGREDVFARRWYSRTNREIRLPACMPERMGQAVVRQEKIQMYGMPQ